MSEYTSRTSPHRPPHIRPRRVTVYASITAAEWPGLNEWVKKVEAECTKIHNAWLASQAGHSIPLKVLRERRSGELHEAITNIFGKDSSDLKSKVASIFSMRGRNRNKPR